MKTKNFYILVIFIAVTSVSLWMVSYPSPTFKNIMTTTQNNIRKIPKHIQLTTAQQLEVDSSYLEVLGFEDSSNVIVGNVKLIVGSAMIPGKEDETKEFLKATRKHVPTRKVILFDMGLSSSNMIITKKLCNETTNCSVRPFLFKKYPSHVQDLGIRSYKPICIQELLNEFGAVIWADTSEYFLTSKMNHSLVQALNVGLVAWTIKDPTSSLTHPKMFDYFKTKQDRYYFHRAVRSSHLIIYNTEKIHKDLMLPWVKCALVEECISPTGAQNSGCNWRKPYYRYSGCHWFDMSALNVILGIMFDFDVSGYSGTENIFGTKYDLEVFGGKNVTGSTVRLEHRIY
ncbi:hypothetical protein SNE40_015387 [Patella caerulea]|uniref:Uncharacterized protein n=1 Tax=Patella caerulea TaxID=87958 RepID=A0AAN8PEP2_PATCE